MYKQMENDFIVYSNYYKSIRMFLFIFIILAIISFIPIIFLTNTLWTLIIMVIFIILFSLILYFYVLNSLKKNKIKKSKHIIVNIEKFKYCNRDTDLYVLVDILREHNIKNNTKLLETLKHYQTLTTRNIKSGNNLLSFIALIISIYALITTENYNYNYYVFSEIVGLILISTFFYIIVVKIIKNLDIFFVRDTINRKMEDLLSEIYIKNLIY